MHYYCEIMYFRPVILVTITEVKNVIKVSESELKKWIKWDFVSDTESIVYSIWVISYDLVLKLLTNHIAGINKQKLHIQHPVH